MTSTHLPEQVRKQIEEAEAIERELYGPGETPVEPTANTEPATPAAEPVAAEPAAPVQEVRQTSSEDWEQKFKVLQGKYNAEVPRLHAQLRELNDVVRQTGAELEKLKTVKPEPAQTTPDNDAEKFGGDLTEAIDRRAAARAQEIVSQRERELQAHIQQLEKQLGGIGEQVQVSAQDQFLSALASRVPEYRSINSDEVKVS